ncbi:MAG: 3-dehydro-L-gulonate 2-dehydrogenase [Bacteroidota bacterium]
MTRIPFHTIQLELQRVLELLGFSEDKAKQSATLFAEASRDGVYSHGLNRFPRYVHYIRQGYIDVHASPSQVAKIGLMEQWDGHLGPGNLNAWTGMERAIQLGQAHGMGVVALRHTNHWMRGGSYGWQAAEAGMIGLCFTNTQPNTPAWGNKSISIGNNPLIIALPRSAGHIVLDTAMTQFAFGKIEAYSRANQLLPVPGGYDRQGQLTQDPKEIELSGRALPFGFWKGSGLTIMLDLLASALAGGMCTSQIGKQGPDEYNLSQVFIAINPLALGNAAHYQEIISHTLDALHQGEAAEAGGQAFYPGERTLQTRRDNLKLGIPVDEKYWAEIQAM